MDILKQYILENWILVLVLMAFAIMLMITVFLNRKTIRRLSMLIVVLFLLSISVFFEFYTGDMKVSPNVLKVLVAIRYSITPIIVSLIIFTLVNHKYWYILIPAGVLLILDFVSIFTGIVFKVDENGVMTRGILGYLPYIILGLYCAALIYIMIRQSNKQLIEIIPISFLAFCFVTGICFPFALGKDFSKIFCSTIAIAVFVYYVFLILQLTKKDALTGLLNRQAYYSDIRNKAKDITAVISIDMNGLKKINDTKGHLAGDQAICAVSQALSRGARHKHSIYRIGGDEFIITCRKITQDELLILVDSIKKSIAETDYSVSIGYSYSSLQDKDLEEMVRVSDLMMYRDKDNYYADKKNKKDYRSL